MIASKAIVLKQINYSDSSLICRLFTKHYGKVTILSKGAKRLKNYTSALLEPINHLNVQYYNKSSREIQILKDASFITNYSNLRKDLCRIVLAFATIEILDKSTQHSNPHPVLYRLTWRVLEKFNDNNQNPWVIFTFYLYQLSLRLGFMPNLSICRKCNNKMLFSGIDNILGEIICQNCISKTENKIYNLSNLYQLTTLHLDELDKIIIEKKDILDSIQLMVSFLRCHVEGLKKINSIDMINNIL